MFTSLPLLSRWMRWKRGPPSLSWVSQSSISGPHLLLISHEHSQECIYFHRWHWSMGKAGSFLIIPVLRRKGEPIHLRLLATTLRWGVTKVEPSQLGHSQSKLIKTKPLSLVFIQTNKAQNSQVDWKLFKWFMSQQWPLLSPQGMPVEQNNHAYHLSAYSWDHC